MATRDVVIAYSMYVIGTVESGCQWNSVNTGDAITIGIMQWYGPRAANLLRQLKDSASDAYALLASSLTSDLDSQTSTDFWQTRFLTDTEADSVASALELDSAHTVQETIWSSDAGSYIDQMCGSWGFSLDNPKPLIFCMCMYHQSPAACARVVSSCGGNADLERIYTTCMNDGTFSRYTNRYNTAYSLLNDWDGASQPPEFGQNGSVSTGGDSSGVTEIQSQLGYIIQRGNNLYVFGKNEYANGVVFYPAGPDRWMNGYNSNGTTIGGGNSGGGSATGNEGQNAVCQWMRDNTDAFSYSQSNPGRLTPKESGYTDCSGCVWAAYWECTGVDINRNGTHYILAQARENGNIIKQGSFTAIGSDGLQPGDLIVVKYNADVGSNWVDTDHVEMYMGDGTTMGMISTPGPETNYNVDTWGTNLKNWWVCRYL